jgi:4'-phosphopantetheinyl transferase
MSYMDMPGGPTRVEQLRFRPLEAGWTRAGRPPGLAEGQVHVWRTTLASNDPALLTPDERERARRFADPAAFVAGRTLLRRTLAAYGETPPHDVTLAYDALGKPRLASPSPLRFNLAHAGELVLLAVASGLEVGIDVEAMAPVADLDAVARLSLTPRELDRLAPLTGPERDAAFIRIWCCKEAWGKWRGDGVAQLLDVEVEIEPGPGPGPGAGLWMLPLGSAYAGALAAPGAAAVQLLDPS